MNRRINTAECTVVGDYISILKPTFDFTFDLYQAIKQHIHKNKKKLSTKKASLFLLVNN